MDQICALRGSRIIIIREGAFQYRVIQFLRHYLTIGPTVKLQYNVLIRQADLLKLPMDAGSHAIQKGNIEKAVEMLDVRLFPALARNATLPGATAPVPARERCIEVRVNPLQASNNFNGGGLIYEYDHHKKFKRNGQVSLQLKGRTL